jgi:hypothetical protein
MQPLQQHVAFPFCDTFYMRGKTAIHKQIWSIGLRVHGNNRVAGFGVNLPGLQPYAVVAQVYFTIMKGGFIYD